MFFNSIDFIIFISAFIPLYFLTRGKTRLWLCLIGSYIFYGWWDYRFLLLIAALTLISFYCGLNLTDKTNPKRNYIFLSISVISSLIILGFFKYYNFFIDNFIFILGLFGFDDDFTTLNIILPVGISFYTFQTMSYTFDVYYKKMVPEKSLLNFATFVAFFPQLVAGPIVRASCFIPQLKTDRVFNPKDIEKGVHMVILGFFLKVVVADSLSIVVDTRFADPEVHDALSMLVGVVFYAFQVYGDFAGYSLIAIGVARILGFKFPVNFDRPYFSSSFSEFWRRWHISLSTWFRDYLYIPLGGSRTGKIKTYRNLLGTMLLCGLWHGAGWNYIIWGGMHGIALSMERMWYKKFPKRQQLSSPGITFDNPLKILKILFVFSVCCVGLTIFTSSSLSDAQYIIKKIIQFDNCSISGITQKFHVVKGVMLISILVFIEAISFHVDTKKIKDKHPYLATVFFAIVLVSISLFGTFENNAFIYFQF